MSTSLSSKTQTPGRAAQAPNSSKARAGGEEGTWGSLGSLPGTGGESSVPSTFLRLWAPEALLLSHYSPSRS